MTNKLLALNTTKKMKNTYFPIRLADSKQARENQRNQKKIKIDLM